MKSENITRTPRQNHVLAIYDHVGSPQEV